MADEHPAAGGGQDTEEEHGAARDEGDSARAGIQLHEGKLD
jgi:hypothetical protein